VNPFLLGGIVAAMAGFLLFLVRDMAVARKALGVNLSSMMALIGQSAVATTALSPTGRILVAGESWRAVSDSGQPIAEGAKVVVGEIDDLTLKVFEASEMAE
jgi:membrane-bound ClpP family serine protease